MAWAAADGLKMNFQQAGVDAVQNMFFNGWTHGHYVNSVFVFTPDGKIRMCVINAPGTFHDSCIADYGIYHGMETVFNATGGKVVVDSAFKITDQEYLIRSSRNDPENAEDLLVNRDATSVRQLSEWGMRMIQGQFPRIKDPIKYEKKGERKIILRLLIHLYNFQTSQVGINTILNSYMQKDDNTFFGHQPLAETANMPNN